MRNGARPLIYMAMPLLLLLIGFTACQQTVEVKVMAWNILHGGNDVEDGPERCIEIIRELDPDVILMVETYGSGPKIADALGYNFHLVAPEGTPPDDKSVNLSIYSRYPFGDRIDTDYPFYLGGREVIIGEQRVRFLSNWFHYDPWEDEPEKLGMTADELLAWEKTGTKYEMQQKVLPYFQQWASEAEEIPLIIGGDMNAPSHLDWGPETAELHNGLVVPWRTMGVLQEIGLIDTYRTIHPDPNTHPGITWDQKGKRDEHRIDYIFYKGSILKPLSSESHNAFLGEPIRLGEKVITYPSDHGIVMTVFEVGS